MQQEIFKKGKELSSWEKKIFFLDSTLPIMLEQHKPPFIGNKGIRPIYVFQMSEWAATGALLGSARCVFHPV